MWRRFALLSVAIVAVIGLAVPALAHLSLSHCPSGALCVWEHPSGGGTQYNFFYSNSEWLNTSNAAIANEDSSWANDSVYGNEVQVYDLSHHRYPTVCLNPQTVSNNWQAYGDKGRSNKWGTSNC